jgi:hypothetical protein
MTKLKSRQFYCVSCRKIRTLPKDDIYFNHDKNGKPRLESQCKYCGTGLFRYVKLSTENSMIKKYGYH